MTRIKAKQYWTRLFIACAKKSNKPILLFRNYYIENIFLKSYAIYV